MRFFYKEDYFDAYNGNYDSISDSDFNRIVSFFPESNIKSRTLLDLGSGTGAFCKPLSMHLNIQHCFGIDLSMSLLRKSTVPCCCGDVLELPFTDESFDLIVAAGAFHHFENISLVIKEVYRCLNKDGYFFAYEPNMYHPQRFIFMTNPTRHIFYRTGDHAISPRNFSNQLDQNGFRQISTNYSIICGKKMSRSIAFNLKIYNKMINSSLKFLLPYISPWVVFAAKK